MLLSVRIMSKEKKWWRRRQWQLTQNAAMNHVLVINERNWATEFGVVQVQSGVWCQIWWVGRSVCTEDQVALRVWSPVRHASKTVPVVNVGVVGHSIAAGEYSKRTVSAWIVFLQKFPHTHTHAKKHTMNSYCSSKWPWIKNLVIESVSYPDKEAEFVVRNNVFWRHHILGQLEKTVTVAPHELANRAHGEGLLIENAKHRAECQSSKAHCVFHLIGCRLKKKRHWKTIKPRTCFHSWITKNSQSVECWGFGREHLRCQPKLVGWRITSW